MSVIKPFTGVDDRVPLAEVLPLDTPFTLNVFPSNLCNFRCNYCAQSLGAKALEERYGLTREQMSLEIMERAVAQAKAFPHRFKLVSMMGHGEPLCNKNLPEMIRMVKEAGIADRVDVITNASLLTHEYSDRLIEAGLDVLRVSLQGISGGSYAKVCGVKLDYSQFLENLSYFYRHKGDCRVYVKTMDVSLGEGEEQRFFDLYSGISDRMFIDKVKPVYDGVEYGEEGCDLQEDRYGNRHGRRLVCPQPFYMLSVWADGSVAPCDALYKACTLGNVCEGTLTEMWSSEQLRQFRYRMLKEGKDEIGACVRCCAPDDVQSEADVLDASKEKLLDLYKPGAACQQQ